MTIPVQTVKSSDGYPIQAAHFDTSTAVYLDGTSAAANGDAATRELFVRITADELNACWVSVGVDAVAVSEEGALINAGATEYTTIRTGERLSVIGGKLNVVICD